MTIKPVNSTLIHKIVVPDSDAKGSFPTLILLHGRGTNEDDLLGLASYLDPRLLIISARAPFQFPIGGWTWYDILEVGSPQPQQFEESYGLLTQFFSDVKKEYPVDSKRVFFMGFSMGAVMSYAITMTRPEEIAGVAAHSGYVPENISLKFALDKLKNSSFFVAHGTHDPVIQVQFARRAQELLTKAGAPLEYHEYPIAHEISEESLSDLSKWLTNKIGPR